MKKSVSVVLASAVKASVMALIPLSVIRVSALTTITKEMSRDIMRAYGYQTLSGPANFLSVALGAAAGVELANAIFTKIPGIGSAAASVATASLHLVTRALLIGVCEGLKSGYVTDKDLQNNSFCKALCAKWISNIGDIIIKLIRGSNPFEQSYY